MSGGRPMRWEADAGAAIPDQYAALERQWGAEVRAHGLGRERLSRVAGISEHAAMAVIRLATGRTVHEAPSLRSPQRPPTSEAVPDGGLSPAVHPPSEPDEEEVAQLIEHRRQVYVQAQRKREDRVRTVRVRDRLPICIAHMGDPHVDDDGCAWPALIDAVETIRDTPGMYAGNVGDVTNNWTGRLMHLWAHQSTGAEEAMQLARWLLRTAPHLYLVGGNHDEWAGGWGALLRLLDSAPISVVARHEARIRLVWPDDEEIRICVRHTYRGSSMWNPTHGPSRAAQLDPWGDLYVAGHHHEAAEQLLTRPDGSWARTVKVAGFKRLDSYAAQHGYAEAEGGEVAYTILDPYAARPPDRIRVMWDPREAADLLGWLRERRG